MIICGRNSTRDFINDYIRRNLLNIKGKYPVIGDKVICKQNQWERCVNDIYLTNGTVGFINDIFDENTNSKRMTIDFVPDYDPNAIYYNVDIDLPFITSPYEIRKGIGLTRFAKYEYAYGITVHSSQGSQYNRLLFIDEPFGGGRELVRKLRYTAISRAVNQIDIVNGYNLLNTYVK